MVCRPEHVRLFEQQVERLASIGSTPIALYGAGGFTKQLCPRARDPRGVIVGVIDDDPRKAGCEWAGLPVISVEDAVSRGVKAVIIAAEGEVQEKVWARRRPLREAGMQVLCCPDRFASRPWDTVLSDFWDMKLAGERGIEVPWLHSYPTRDHKAPGDVARCLSERLPEGGAVCEIGAGYGMLTEVLLPRAGTYHVVDYSDRLLFEVIEHRFGCELGRLRLHHDTSARLVGVEDGSVDLLFAFDVFVHIPIDLTHQYLASAKRVLRTGGRAVIHFREWDRKNIEEWERSHLPYSVGGHSNMYFNDMHTLKQSAEYLGLRVERIEGVPANWMGFMAEFTHAG